MNKFCHECGKQLPVVAGMKFCPFCTTSLLSLSSKPAAPAQAAAAAPARPTTFKPFSSRNTDDDYEYVDDLEHAPINISKLDVEVNVPRQAQETVGGTMNTPFISNEGPRPSPNLTHEQVAADFKREAGALIPETTQRTSRAG